VIAGGGYPGIALLMVLENVFPPLPSELIMPMAGFVAASGQLQIAWVVVAGTLGSVVGALPWYFAGRAFGQRRLEHWAGRHGRWLALRPDDVSRAATWFERHCGKAVLLGRLVPAVRTLVSVPAGLFSMSLRRFVLYTAVGSLAWTALLAGLGYSLRDDYRHVEQWANPVGNAVFGAIVLVYLYRVATWNKQDQ
jgi:membrane protein DedA with SNARE-associated domain